MRVIGLDPETLRKSVADLVSVRVTNIGVDAEMPLVYPSGETVVVTVTPEHGRFLVHDGGRGSMSLLSHGINISPKMLVKLTELAAHYHCSFEQGRMSRVCTSEDLSMALVIVANASRTIADQAFNAPHMPAIDFRTEALEALRSAIGANRLRENEPVSGESGSRYSATAMILADDEETPLGLFEPIKDHEAATKRFREFWDISQNSEVSGLARIAMYDDRKKWQAADLTLLQNVCNVVRMTDLAARMREFGGRLKLA